MEKWVSGSDYIHFPKNLHSFYNQSKKPQHWQSKIWRNMVPLAASNCTKMTTQRRKKNSDELELYPQNPKTPCILKRKQWVLILSMKFLWKSQEGQDLISNQFSKLKVQIYLEAETDLLPNEKVLNWSPELQLWEPALTSLNHRVRRR